MTVTPVKAIRKTFVRTSKAFGHLKRQSRPFIHGLSLKLVQNNVGAIQKDDVLLVCCLRNEMLRLPFFINYYRKLGVDHFLFVDNGSTDGLLDWIRQHEDCSVWTTSASYLKSDFGMQWCNYLLRRYGSGRLCVTVDPDEFLVYPHVETRSLRDLGQFIKDDNRASMHVVMLDAYSDKPLRDTIYSAGDDPFAICPYFDRDGYTQKPGYGRGTFVQGGPRMRVHNRITPDMAPALNKVPIVWWRPNFTYRSSMHDLQPFRLNLAHTPHEVSITGCLFHFKFMSSLIQKATEEVSRKQHYAGSREYDQYREGSERLLFEDGISIRYESPQQLIELGLMCPGRWI